MKALSIVSLIGFVLNFLLMVVFLDGSQDGAEVAAGLGLMGVLYGLFFSIVAVIISSKRKKAPVNVHEQLLQLGELKEKISFQNMNSIRRKRNYSPDTSSPEPATVR